LGIAGAVLNPRLPFGTRLTALLRAGLFYSFWYPRQWIVLSYWPRYARYGRLGARLRYVDRTSKRLARTLFHLMVLHGPKLEFRQLQLGRIVDIAVDLFAIAATVGRALKGTEPHIRDVADVFCD